MAQSIQHLVVLMLENRAFDHMIGFMAPKTGTIDGLTGNEFNPSNPINPTDQHPVSNTADFVLKPDPGHSIPDTNVQLFSRLGGPPPLGPSNFGFIWNYSQQRNPPADPTSIMKCFDPAKLPALTTLAREFAVCDAWYSSVPGPTWPNRFFAHAATSKGFIDNSQFNNYDMPTIFERLAERGLTWRDYYHDFSQTWALQHLQTDENRINFRSFGTFKRDARNGALPNYAFIEPKYFSFFGEANDQHPPHDIRAGEKLIAEVYEALRQSPQWLNTMLLITYDEHGGTYDHVLPQAATPPDSHTSQFAFDRYGLRVPAVIVSPFVPAAPVHTPFDHTSIPATLAALFGLSGFLTARDAVANRFDVAASLQAARTDLPNLSAVAQAQVESMATPSTIGTAGPDTGESELSDFQLDLLDLARSLERTFAPVTTRARTSLPLPGNEHEAAIYVRHVAAHMAADDRAAAEQRPAQPGVGPAREGVPERVRSGRVYRTLIRPHSNVGLPFSHAAAGDSVQLRFVVTDANGQVQATARYVATVDDPFGGGNLDDPLRGALPPLVFNNTDDEMFVDVTASVGAPSFAVPLECDVEQVDASVTVLFFHLDGRQLLTVFVRS